MQGFRDPQTFLSGALVDKNFLWKPQLEIALGRSLHSSSPRIKEGDRTLDLGPDIAKTLGEHPLIADPTTKGHREGGEG